jgi:PhnB protein
MKADPYLIFGGTCGEAVEFYRSVLGAELRALVRFRDLPGATPEAGDKVMHVELDLGGSTIFASDGRGDQRSESAGFAISLQVGNDSEAERLFSALAADGTIEVPLMTTPFASRFGMARDRFGTPWMIVTPQTAGS